MKVLLSFSVLAFAVLSSVYGAPADQTQGQSTAQAADLGAPPTTSAATTPRDGVLMEKGVVYTVQKGERKAVQKETHLPDGSVVHQDGRVTLKGGANLKLEDGQFASLDGRVSQATPSGATSTSTDKPVLHAPAVSADGKSSNVEQNSASPTGATRNMAPTRGQNPSAAPAADTSSASGLTVPGASSGSSLGSGSNSTTSKDTAKPSGAAK